jgi:hypothetical protein
MRTIALWTAVLGLLVLGGCVERELTIRSQPAGAVVYVSDVEVGRTPVTVPFTYYGDYDIILRKDGYETLKTHAKLCAPWYEVPPLDFFSEIAPWTYRDKRYVSFDLEEQTLAEPEQLIDRAEAMRERTNQPVEGEKTE